jgi:glycosyltransferase involved in cell wall biosynthesis
VLVHPETANNSDCDLPYTPKAKGVLMVTGALARGGAERQMFALTYGLLQQGFDVQVLELIGVAADQASFAEEFTNIGVRLRHADEFSAAAGDDIASSVAAGLSPFALLVPANYASLCRASMLAIEDFRPSAVYCWSDTSNLIGGFASSRMRVPRIMLGQRVLPPPFWFDAFNSELYRQAYRMLASDRSVVFVNNSAMSVKEYESWMQFASGTIKLVNNGFLPSSIKIRKPSERAACRTHFGLRPDGPVVGAIMRFAHEKDPDLWLETAAAIASARPDVSFLLAGYGHEAVADELFQKGRELGLATRLVMPGMVIDVGQVYGALDVLLLTSRLENVPNVMIEAQAAGIPVVGPALGGIGETMLDGVTGVVVADRSCKALASAVLEILDDASWRERAAAEGPAFVAERFGHERMVHEMIAIHHLDAPHLRSRLSPGLSN